MKHLALAAVLALSACVTHAPPKPTPAPFVYHYPRGIYVGGLWYPHATYVGSRAMFHGFTMPKKGRKR